MFPHALVFKNMGNFAEITYRIHTKVAMKKIIPSILLSAYALAATGQTTEARTTSGDTPREIYGWFLKSAKYGAGQYGYAAINLSDPSDYHFIYNYDISSAIGQYAGAAVDGIYYGCEYTIGNAMMPPEAAAFVRYNMFTGVKEDIGQWNSGDNLIDANFKSIDMTYDYRDKEMYCLGFLLGTTSLYTVDLDNGRFTKVVDIQDGGSTLASDASGNLYTITMDGWLCQINKTNGNLTQLFNTGRPVMYMQSMEFDLTTGKLYWASNQVSPNLDFVYDLIEFDLSDPADITMTNLGTIDDETGVHALYIPYAEGGLNAPAAPYNISAKTATDGSLSVNLTWTNPTTAFGGTPLDSEITGVVIFREGQQLGYVTGPNTTSFIDNTVTTNGEYRYDIMAINAYGSGGKGTIYAYVGEDSPAAVGNLTLTPATGCGSATISWDAVTEGIHGGLFSKPEDVTYNVIRKPDNFVVASGIKETTVTDDKIVRLLNYSYQVEAVNEMGKSTSTTNPIVLGPAKEAPYEDLFEDTDAVNNQWTQVDGNGDGYTWMLNTNLGYTYFGSYASGFEYFTSPTQGISKDADEWLISPPFKFEGGKEYELAIFNRSYRAETVELHMAGTNMVADMGNPISTIILRDYDENDYDEAENCIRIITYVEPLPVFDTETIKCVGLHLVSPLLFQMDSFLQINGIGIAEKGTYEAGVENVAAGSSEAVLNGRLLHAGDNTATSVYTISGSEVIRSTASEIDLGSLQAGVYVIRISSPRSVRAIKVVLK